MRELINENRMVQVALVGVLFVAGGLMLMTQMGGGGGASSADPATSTTPPTATAGTTAPTTTPAPAGTDPAAVDPAAVAGAPGAAATSVATPPPPVAAPDPPRSFVSAYDRGDTVVLLVVRPKGIEDQLVEPAVRSLGAVPGVKAFVVPVDKIARYAAVTQSVEVSRVPALIVVRPQKLSDGVPQASVSYGFRSPQSVVQAVRDAQYEGPEGTYNPD